MPQGARLSAGGGCNCYLGNDQIKWALIKKGLPLETTLFSVSYFSHACLANRTLIREAPGIFSHTRIRTQQDQLLRLNTYCCVRSINSINWHTCVHSVHCTPFKIVTATAFLSEKIQFCAVEAPESHLLRKSRLAPDNQSWFNRFWPPGFVITFPVIDSAVLEGVFKRSIKDPALSHPYVSSVWTLEIYLGSATSICDVFSIFWQSWFCLQSRAANDSLITGSTINNLSHCQHSHNQVEIWHFFPELFLNRAANVLKISHAAPEQIWAPLNSVSFWLVIVWHLFNFEDFDQKPIGVFWSSSIFFVLNGDDLFGTRLQC